jgi:acetyl-CoA carboxylase carboxyl transferase subunit alpha
VISPEGCAAILWKSGEKTPEAAEALKLTSRDLMRLGLIDAVIGEPLGGAHRDPAATVAAVRDRILGWIAELSAIAPDDLLAARHDKFRRMGTPLGM